MKGQNGEASEYVIHGDALKKIVRKSRRRPMAFAFVPTFGDDESMFAVHKKRKPEVVARKTKLASGQSRIAFGTFMVVGKTMVLTCVRELPSIAKKLRKHLREERIPLSIRVLDMMGRELEAEIEDSDDGEDPLGPDDDDDDDDDDDGPSARAPGPAASDPIGARIAEIRPLVATAGGARGEKLRDMLSGLIQARADGTGVDAARLLSRLEEELRALMNSVDRPQAAPSPDRIPDRPRPTRPDPPPSVVSPDPPDRAEALRLARRITALRQRAETLDGEAGGRLLAALGVAAKALRADETQAAADAIARIAAVLDRVEAQQGVTRPPA